MQRVIGLLKATFTHLILDLSKSYSPVDMVALQLATQVLLVTQLDLPCLRNVVRLMMSFGEIDGLKDKIKIVVNRVGPRFGPNQLEEGAGDDRLRNLLATAQRLPHDVGSAQQRRAADRTSQEGPDYAGHRRTGRIVLARTGRRKPLRARPRPITPQGQIDELLQYEEVGGSAAAAGQLPSLSGRGQGRVKRSSPLDSSMQNVLYALRNIFRNSIEIF